MKYVPLLTAIIVAMLNIYSVSAQKKGDVIAMPVQNADETQYFLITKNNFHYLQYGLFAHKQAVKSLPDIRSNQSIFLLDAITPQKQKFNIIIVITIFLFLSAILFFILFLRREKKLKTYLNDKEVYEDKIIAIEKHFHEIDQKNIALKSDYDELQLKYNNLQKTSAIKDKLIPMIAHDIRSPLASLQSTLSLTREHILNPEEFQKISFALEADVFNLRGMLDNMLLWAREQMFEIKVNKIKFDISEISRDVILMYRNNLVGKNITLHNYLPQHLEVSTDKEIISAVFRNLFSNAVKFTETGKNIYISQIFFNGKAYISVKDEGKGMQQETIHKLNNKEYISTRGTANEKGTGLGLMFSRDMLNKLEEVFDITSYPNQGTSVTFSVSLS